MTDPKITPFLWFDNQAEEAVTFYTSIFNNARITGVVRHSEAGPGPAGTVMTMGFELEGQPFTALNGGPQFTFTPAISLVIHCQTQDEVDHYWERLSEGGRKDQCGWLQDRYGVSWQVVPTILTELLQDEDEERAQRVMKAMLGMQKLEIAGLQQAYAGALEQPAP